MSFVALLIATLLAAPDLAAPARERSREIAGQGTWTPADLQGLLTLQLVDPERFVSDEAFRARVLEALPRSLDPSVPPRLRDELLFELNQVRGIDFAASEAIETGWGAAPRRALERKVPFPAGAADRLRFFDEAEDPLAASVYSLPSFFFSPEAAQSFLAGVRRAAPNRTLIVLTDVPLRRRLEGSGLDLRLLETYGRPYSPWPRDPFSLVRSPSGAVRVLVRPNLQADREEDASLGAELIQNLPEDLDRAWGGTAWTEAPVPFHNGQVLLTRDAAWVTLHTLEPHVLANLKLDRVPVETFSDAKGIDRYVTAVEKAAKDLETLYGRPVRFVHPLRSADGIEGGTLMRRFGGGAGYDLDSIVTLLPGKKALVADAKAGRELLAKMTSEDWKSLRDGYGLQPKGEALAPSAALGSFLDLVADHLRREGMEVRRLPLLAVPVSQLRNREGLSHDEFLITWNNVVAETRDGRLRAEGFASLIPTGDRLAREAFAAAGAHLDLFPPLVRSVVLNGGYRCASNHARTANRR